MSHYTLASGVRTTTVSYVCPTCRRRSTLPPDEAWAYVERHYLPPELLYCSHDCREAHTTELVRAVSKVYPIFHEKALWKLLALHECCIPGDIAMQLQGVTP